MKYKKIIIGILAILFFLVALTSWVNRVIFPRLIKKIAVERLESTLKRKVEIGRIRFSWVKGIVIDKIKLYEKSPADTVFAQADQVSFGVLFLPGIKHNRITIPYINVRSPAARLIRTGEDTWNFSDLLASPASPAASSTDGKKEKTSSLEIAWGGITLSDGKLLLNDNSKPRRWSEFFDNINLKLSLSYKGISYDFTADIPGKKGSVGATVYYQPITGNTQAQVHLKNIDTASYLSLVDIPDVHLDSGTITEINLKLEHDREKTSAQGDMFMKNLDITGQQQHFKGDIEILGLNAQYQNGGITARGQIALNEMRTSMPGLSAGGSIRTNVNDFELTREGVSFTGSLHARDFFIDLKDRQVQAADLQLENIRVKKDLDGIHSVGSVKTRGLFIQWPDQMLRGDITMNAMTMHIKDGNNISLEGEVQAENLELAAPRQSGGLNLNSRHLVLENARMDILDQKNIALNTKLSLNDLTLLFGKNILSAGSLQTDKLSFNLDDGIIKSSASLNASKAGITFNHLKTIEADPHLELTLQMPFNAPREVTYKGSVTFSNGRLIGFYPIPSLDNVVLDADFRNDEAVINALSINLLDTNLSINGTLKNFNNPLLNITADAEEFNLKGLKNLFPQMVNQYGLSFNGTSFVKIKFEGLAYAPFSADILGVATVKNVSIISSKLHQQLNGITGTIEMTPRTLGWRNFTANWQRKQYTSSGSLKDFKKPAIMIAINGPGLQLKADLLKEDQLITINSVTGNYRNTAFDASGTVALFPPKAPVFDIDLNASMLLSDLINEIPSLRDQNASSLKPTGMLSLRANLKGPSLDWKNCRINAAVTSPIIRLMGYKLTEMKIHVDENRGKIKNLSFDGKFYEGDLHAVGAMDLSAPEIPYDLAFNISNTDLRQLKMDSPLKMNEINGKLYFTSLAHGTIADFKNNLHASGSLALRDGFLGEFNVFKGLLDVLNDAMSLSKVMITDVEANFTVDNQKISTDNLRLKGPTIILLGKGWINFEEYCDLNMTVDLSSGVIPAMAHDVLKSLSIRVYDKISNPKFKKKISVPQVINTLLKNIWQ